MADVVEIGSRRLAVKSHKPDRRGEAQILIFTGVRVERLEGTDDAADSTREHQQPTDPTLRNRAI